MCPRSIQVFVVLMLGVCLAGPAVAQGHGGTGTSGAGSRPDGVGEKDTLKDFHNSMAAQATSQQLADFQALLKSTETAKSELQTFLHVNEKLTLASAKLDRSLENERTLGRKFLEGFSPKQKDLLKESTRRLEKADSGLEEQQKKFDQVLQASAGGSKGASNNEIPAASDAVDKSLAELSLQQLALGREMGISVASAQDPVFTLPIVKNAVRVGAIDVDVAVSGELSQTAAEGNNRKFQVSLIGDLSDLQHNVTEVLRTQFNDNGACGERLSIRQAMISPTVPASLLRLELHYERWSCLRLAGQSSPTEIAESDGSVDLKLVPALDASGALQLKTAFAQIDAAGMMGESLRSGNLGDDLREKVSLGLLPVLTVLADVRTLPPVLREAVKLQSVKFRDAGAAILSLALEGEVRLSNEQASALANQLNQTLSAQDARSQ